MKFTKKRGCTGSIRKVWSDDMEVCFGTVGTVGDLLEIGILEYADHPSETWMFIPGLGILQRPRFGETREEALAGLPC